MRYFQTFLRHDTHEVFCLKAEIDSFNSIMHPPPHKQGGEGERKAQEPLSSGYHYMALFHI